MLVPITLKNTSDSTLFRAGFLAKENIREIKLNAVFKKDWKCRLVIPTRLQEILGLSVKVTRTIFFDEKSEYFVGMSEAVELEIETRRTTICPFLMTDLRMPIIGSILFDELNLEIDSNQNLKLLERRLKI